MIKRKGFYIVFEGISGCGKTTQSKLLETKLKNKFPNKEILRTWEPGGGSEIAESIRKIFQGTKFREEMEPLCEQYLVAAARAQTLKTIVFPALKRGAIVLSDYSFFTSLAYQGFGRGLGFEKVFEINSPIIGQSWPDLVIILDMPIKTAAQRVFDIDGDKFETLGSVFFKQVKKGYRFLAKKYPNIVKIIDGTGTIEKVGKRIDKLISHCEF